MDPKSFSTTTTTTIFIHTIQEKKKEKQRKYRKRNGRDYIIICSIRVSVQQPK